MLGAERWARCAPAALLLPRLLPPLQVPADMAGGLLSLGQEAMEAYAAKCPPSASAAAASCDSNATICLPCPASSPQAHNKHQKMSIFCIASSKHTCLNRCTSMAAAGHYSALLNSSVSLPSESQRPPVITRLMLAPVALPRHSQPPQRPARPSFPVLPCSALDLSTPAVGELGVAPLAPPFSSSSVADAEEESLLSPPGLLGLLGLLIPLGLLSLLGPLGLLSLLEVLGPLGLLGLLGLVRVEVDC